MLTNSFIAILTISKAIIQSCMGGSGWFSKGSELSWISNYCISLVEIQSKLKTIVLTSSFIAILIISRAIIQSCISGSGWFSKGSELSWISSYCISLVEIQSKVKTIVLTSSFIAILIISRAIIQSCISGSGWFSRGTELS